MKVTKVTAKPPGESHTGCVIPLKWFMGSAGKWIRKTTGWCSATDPAGTSTGTHGTVWQQLWGRCLVRPPVFGVTLIGYKRSNAYVRTPAAPLLPCGLAVSRQTVRAF